MRINKTESIKHLDDTLNKINVSINVEPFIFLSFICLDYSSGSFPVMTYLSLMQ